MPGKLIEHPRFYLPTVKMVLSDQGFDVSEQEVAAKDLTEVSHQALVSCMDDRREKGNDKSTQVKVGGGGLFIMGEITGGNVDGMRGAQRFVNRDGYTLGLHGDDDNGFHGCGWGKLWRDGKLAMHHPLEIDQEEIIKAMLDEQLGVYQEFVGSHQAEFLEINPFTRTTRQKTGRAVYLDLWYPLQLGMDQSRVLGLHAQAVKGLHLPTKARILRAAA